MPCALPAGGPTNSRRRTKEPSRLRLSLSVVIDSPDSSRIDRLCGVTVPLSFASADPTRERIA